MNRLGFAFGLAALVAASACSTDQGAVQTLHVEVAEVAAAVAGAAEAVMSGASEAVSATADAVAEAVAPAAPPPAKPDLARGKAVYDGACFACHATGAAGAAGAAQARITSPKARSVLI